MSNEVGLIGQKYEERKSGRTGVLISRDEKYRTLCMQADDGSTFNISNSTFKSNWRKSKSVEEPVENDKPEVIVHADDGLPTNVDNDVAKHQAKRSVQKMFTLADFDEFVQNVTVMVDGIKHELVISKNNHTGRVGIKDRGKVLFELWFHYNATNFNLHMKPYLYELIPWKDENQDVPTVVRDGWINNTVRVYERTRLSSVLEDVLRGCAIYVDSNNDKDKESEE